MQLPRSSCTPDDVLICADAIVPPDLDDLSASIAEASISDSLVSKTDEADDADVRWSVDKNVRDTQELKLSRADSARLDAILASSVRKVIEPFFRIKIRDWEPVQVLHYGVGGHYIPHVDAETLYKDDIGLEMWEKTLDRDLSVVYFLNDNFAGGELFFPVLDLLIKPRAGTLVCFPSDHHFVHGVRPVTYGRRFTAVTWMRVKGMPSIDKINQEWLAKYESAWPKQIEQPSHLTARRRSRS